MHRHALFACLMALAVAGGAAKAEPRNAGWGAARPGVAGGCASCHFAGDPVTGSSAIAIDGLPDTVEAGVAYSVTLSFATPEARTAAFLASFDAGEVIAGDEALQLRRGAVRSPEAVAAPAAWSFTWRAPATPGDVVLNVVANAGNDDASPFGDVVHYAERRVAVE
ncbi:MAG: hypothetical protein GC152_05445 [Alphaproteobacteria bacterium]|nr:hypothetical protein [Alphaproteobacteria bacterium]